MNASWFKKQGYQKVDKNGMRILLWKPFVDQAILPRWIRPKKRPSTILGKIGVTAFINDWCPAQNMVFERVKRAGMELGDKVAFQEIYTHHHKTFLEWESVMAFTLMGMNGIPVHPPIMKRLKRF